MCTLPLFKSKSNQSNIISDEVYIAGTIRTIEETLSKDLEKDIIKILEDLK